MEFGISTGLCCQVVKGDIWNPARYRVGTKGSEMRRRLYAAFDLGLRAAEILAVQLKHVDFKPVAVKVDGRQRQVLVISLPAALTKGGKTTGEIEHVYAGSERLKKELARRRFQLKRNPDAYVFVPRTGGVFEGSGGCGGSCSDSPRSTTGGASTSSCPARSRTRGTRW
jgi:integrase